MEDTDEFKWALKVVIKRQMRDLMEQLRERGEEIAILTVNLEDNSCSHFGSPNGEWFVSEQKNLIQNFLNFCQTKGKNKRTGYTPSYSYYSPAPAAASKKPAGFKQKATPTTPEKSTATSDMPLVKVTVPRHLAGDISEEELAGLVGRIVATQLVMQEKGDGSTGGTKFDLLLDAANQWKSKDELSSVMSTPSTRSTRKRKVTAKFREGINSLKKGKKSEEEEDVSEQETSHEDSMIFKILAVLNSATLKRVRVKLSDETTVDVEHSTLTSSEKFESLAVQVIQELDEVASGLLTNKKVIKLEIIIAEDSSEDDDVLVEVDVQGRKYERQKQQLDSSEPNMDTDFPELELDSADSDVDYNPEVKDSDKGFSITKPQIKLGGLKKGRRRRQPPSAVTPFPCDYCGRQIIGKGNLDIHIKRVHLKEKDKKCEVCPKAFFGTRALESHVLSVHTKMCHMCNEYVAETETWPEGIDMFKARTVICKCGGQVVFQCKMGRKREYEVDDDAVDVRKRQRHEKRQFACSHCGKLFTSKYHCLRHARRHTDVKDIECDYCNETFRYENSLKKHLQKEHRIYSHVCEFCNESFASKSDLGVHYRRKHTTLKGSSDRKKSKEPPAVVGHNFVSGASPRLTTKKVTSITQHTQGTSRQEPQGLGVRAPQNPAIAVSSIQAPLNHVVSGVRAPQNPVVAVSVADGESLDSITYNIVQQVLQGNDQVFTEDGKTVIIRTVHE